MKIGSAFPSSYLKQSDVGDKKVLVTIDRVEIEQIGQGNDQEQKPVLYFKGHDKGMVLNLGNAQAVTEIVGDDETDNWPGHRVVLYVDKSVMFGGKRVGGLRITAPPTSKSKPAPVPVQDVVEDFQATDEDLPF